MGITDIVFAVISLLAIFSLILLVIFGQVTVRKLRKNPDTRRELGIEFISGWDIINVAEALALPDWIIRKLRRSVLRPLYANRELLSKYTNRCDRFLAKSFFYLLAVAGILLIGFTILDLLLF